MGCRHSNLSLEPCEGNSAQVVRSNNMSDDKGIQERALTAFSLYKDYVDQMEEDQKNTADNEYHVRSEAIRKAVQSSISSIECPICFEKYSETHVPCTLPCGHSFCIDHVPHIRSCPICREPCPPEHEIMRSISLIEASNALSTIITSLMESETSRLQILSESRKIEYCCGSSIKCSPALVPAHQNHSISSEKEIPPGKSTIPYNRDRNKTVACRNIESFDYSDTEDTSSDVPEEDPNEMGKVNYYSPHMQSTNRRAINYHTNSDAEKYVDCFEDYPYDGDDSQSQNLGETIFIMSDGVRLTMDNFARVNGRVEI